LTGPVPWYIGFLSKLRHLDLSENSLSGPLPLELSYLTSIRFLNLRNNLISGPITAVPINMLSNLAVL
jgi:Leucine-rich repeat (LRR) protein